MAWSDSIFTVSEIMRKNEFIFIITIVLGLSSCSVPTMPQFMYSPPNEKEQVEQQEKLVLDTINTIDVSKIKELFSKNALAKIDDIDGKLKEFPDFYSRGICFKQRLPGESKEYDPDTGMFFTPYTGEIDNFSEIFAKLPGEELYYC